MSCLASSPEQCCQSVGHCCIADDLEDGAYVVMEEEDEEGDQANEQAQPAGSELPAQANHAGDAEPISTEDDRYVATAYDVDEEQHRCLFFTKCHMCMSPLTMFNSI